jgi:hypothetical protein
MRPIVLATICLLATVVTALAQEPPPIDPVAPASPTPAPLGALVTPSPTPKGDLPGEPTTPSEPDWEKAAAPNEPHERLAKLVGKWDLEMNAASPGEAPMQCTGTIEYASILGGRFVTEHAIVDMGGQLFEWQGILGFDNDKRKYTAVWVDNMGTDMELAEGVADAAGGKITFDGKTREPGGAVVRFIWIVTLPEKDTARIEMRLPDQSGDTPVLRLDLRRAKASE